MSDTGLPGGEGGRLSVRISVPKVALCSLGSALFVVVGAVLCSAFLVNVLSREYGVSLAERVVSGLAFFLYLIPGLASVLFFGYALLFFASRLLLFWRPALEVGPEGILDRASALSAGLVSWEEIKDVRPVVMMGQSVIAIKVKDESELLERQGFLKRLARRINRRYFTSAPINVPQIALSVPQQEILAAIKPYLDPKARDRLSKHLSRFQGRRAGVPEGYWQRRITPGDVLGTVPSVLQWLWALVLTFFLLMAGAMFGLFGGIAGWSGLRAVFGIGSGQGEWWHAPVGLAMIALGVLLIFRLTPLVRRLSGREPPANM